MRREKMAWLIAVGLIAVLALQIPGTLAQRDDDYAFVRTLVDIHRQVSANYVEPVDEDNLHEAAINGMLAELDPYSVYVPPAKQEDFDRLLEGSFKGVGIQLNETDAGKIEVVTPIDGSPAFRAGVQAGDVILKVNGESVENVRLPDVVKKIGGKLGTTVKLTVRHATGDEAELEMAREEIVVPTIKGYQRAPDNSWDYYVCDDPKIAYLRITQFTPDTFDDLKAATDKLLPDGMRGLILDLRFNPGGRLDQAVKVVDLFVRDGVIVRTKGRNRPERIERAQAEGTLPQFPMIVLVNEHSASAAEIVSGSLMDNKRALVVGQRSYGKGSVQEVIPLDQKGGELKLTVAYYYLPSGRLVHKKKDATDWGVQPQIVVPMDPAAEAAAMKARYEQEIFRRPLPKSTTRSATMPATTQAIDAQLQRAVDTMIALVVLQGEAGAPPSAAPVEVPMVTTAPATAPGPRPTVPQSPDSTGPEGAAQPVPVTRPAPVPAATTRTEIQVGPPATVPSTTPATNAAPS